MRSKASTTTSAPPVLSPDRFALQGTHGAVAGLVDAGDGRSGLYFAHATGFCKEVWLPVAGRIRSRRQDVDLVMWDGAAHGESDNGEPPFDWWTFGKDALIVADSFPHRTRIGVGHSMGGAALVMAEITRPGTFSGLLLIEPIIFRPPFVRLSNPLADGALRRRRSFSDRRAILDNFESKAVFEDWHPSALEAYVDGGFVDEGDEMVLRCDPEHESDIYQGGSAHGAFSRLGEVRVPVLLLAGEESTTFARGDVEHLAGQFPRASVLMLAGAGHFAPMERPVEVADLILEFTRRTASPDAS